MSEPKKKQPLTMSDVLREAMLAADHPLLTLERETGVKRASMRFFLHEERTLNLNVAYKLVAHFGLGLLKRKGN